MRFSSSIFPPSPETVLADIFASLVKLILLALIEIKPASPCSALLTTTLELSLIFKLLVIISKNPASPLPTAPEAILLSRSIVTSPVALIVISPASPSIVVAEIRLSLLIFKFCKFLNSISPLIPDFVSAVTFDRLSIVISSAFTNI